MEKAVDGVDKKFLFATLGSLVLGIVHYLFNTSTVQWESASTVFETMCVII